MIKHICLWNHCYLVQMEPRAALEQQVAFLELQQAKLLESWYRIAKLQVVVLYCSSLRFYHREDWTALKQRLLSWRKQKWEVPKICREICDVV